MLHRVFSNGCPWGSFFSAQKSELPLGQQKRTSSKYAAPGAVSKKSTMAEKQKIVKTNEKSLKTTKIANCRQNCPNPHATDDFEDF